MLFGPSDGLLGGGLQRGGGDCKGGGGGSKSSDVMQRHWPPSTKAAPAATSDSTSGATAKQQSPRIDWGACCYSYCCCRQMWLLVPRLPWKPGCTDLCATPKACVFPFSRAPTHPGRHCQETPHSHKNGRNGADMPLTQQTQPKRQYAPEPIESQHPGRHATLRMY